MRKRYALLPWILPCMLHSGEALAWGLYTHVYFAQLLIWAIPIADPRFRRAVKRFPELLLGGACLPDIALFSRFAGAGALGTTHQWSVACRMLRRAYDDPTRALSAGFASHLLTDIIAHNHFVPAHEELWFDAPVATHACSEWAMDAHLAPQLFARPSEIIGRHMPTLARYGAGFLDCETGHAGQALRWLQHGERLLRTSRLPAAALRAACWSDGGARQRFDLYVRETTARLGQINRIITGDAPAWQPETGMHTARMHASGHAHHRQPLPQDFF